MTDWQRQVSDFAHRRHLLQALAVRALNVVSEAGEVEREMLLTADHNLWAF